MSEKTDKEIAAWLTANARAGMFTAEQVAAFPPENRAEVLAWIECDTARRRIARKAEAEWVRIFEHAGPSVVFRDTDPGQP